MDFPLLHLCCQYKHSEFISFPPCIKNCIIKGNIILFLLFYRYEGTASYPDQYNNGGANNYHGAPSNQYGAPSNQYGAPGFGSGGGQGGYSGGYDNSQYNSGAYNAQSPTSSVSIKDYSNGGSGYNTGNNYNNGYNAGQNYDNYNSGGFGGKIVPTPVYGAP